MSIEEPEDTSALSTLRSQGMTVADPTQDIRGRKIHQKDGTDIGMVTDLLIDTEQHKGLFRFGRGGVAVSSGIRVGG